MRVLLTKLREQVEQRNPISILDLAAYYRVHGHSVDCSYIDQLDDLASDAYDLVGLSVLQVTEPDSPLAEACLLKSRFKARIVVGGKWTETATAEEKARFAEEGIEVWTGPGERLLVDREIELGDYPAWSKADLESLGDAFPEVMSSRGCPYRCRFCHNTEHRVSYFDPVRTADNIELLLGLGQEEIFFVDDVFLCNTGNMESIYQELHSRGIDIAGRCKFFGHVNFINDETIAWISRYRPIEVQIGIESGDDRMLKAMGKRFTAAKALSAVSKLHDAGHKVNALFMIGYPGENEESLRNTYQLIRELRSMVKSLWVSYYQPVPGTEGHRLAMARAPDMVHARRNTDITYVDPELTEKTLFRYRHMMLAEPRDSHRLLAGLEKTFIRVSPYPAICAARRLKELLLRCRSALAGRGSRA
jgi:radical SAM superfamily enzyme YgiQ (UPF0313 family)